MDKQGRLTQEREWEVGAWYRWLKGGELGNIAQCIEVRPSINSLGGHNEFGAVFLKHLDGREIRYGRNNWSKRWTKINPPAPTGNAKSRAS